MLEFFDQIIGFIESVFQFLINIVESLILLIAVIPGAIALPLTLAGYLPGIIATAVMSIVAIGVAKLIVGR